MGHNRQHLQAIANLLLFVLVAKATFAEATTVLGIIGVDDGKQWARSGVESGDKLINNITHYHHRHQRETVASNVGLAPSIEHYEHVKDENRSQSSASDVTNDVTHHDDTNPRRQTQSDQDNTDKSASLFGWFADRFGTSGGASETDRAKEATGLESSSSDMLARQKINNNINDSRYPALNSSGVSGFNTINQAETVTTITATTTTLESSPSSSAASTTTATTTTTTTTTTPTVNQNSEELDDDELLELKARIVSESHNQSVIELNAFEAAKLGFYRHPPLTLVILSIAYTIVFIIGLIGNSLVVVIVCKSPRMRTVTNYFIANLALADILVLLFCLPATLVGNLFIPYVLGQFVCKTVSFLQGVAVSASINTMVTVTLDRFLAICFPMDWHMSRRMARRVIACIWLFSSIIMSPWAVYFHLAPYPMDLNDKTINIQVCAEDWPSEQIGKMYFVCANLILLYLFPATVIILCYLGIWYKIERRDIPGDRPKGLKIELIMQKSKLKVIKMMMVVVMVFLLSWLPLYLIFTRVKLADERAAWEDWLISKTMPLAQWLGASNSCINPILYTFFNRKYKRGFIDLLRIVCCCDRSKSRHSQTELQQQLHHLQLNHHANNNHHHRDSHSYNSTSNQHHLHQQQQQQHHHKKTNENNVGNHQRRNQRQQQTQLHLLGNGTTTTTTTTASTAMLDLNSTSGMQLFGSNCNLNYQSASAIDRQLARKVNSADMRHRYGESHDDMTKSLIKSKRRYSNGQVNVGSSDGLLRANDIIMSASYDTIRSSSANGDDVQNDHGFIEHRQQFNDYCSAAVNKNRRSPSSSGETPKKSRQKLTKRHPNAATSTKTTAIQLTQPFDTASGSSQQAKCTPPGSIKWATCTLGNSGGGGGDASAVVATSGATNNSSSVARRQSVISGGFSSMATTITTIADNQSTTGTEATQNTGNMTSRVSLRQSSSNAATTSNDFDELPNDDYDDEDDNIDEAKHLIGDHQQAIVGQKLGQQQQHKKYRDQKSYHHELDSEITRCRKRSESCDPIDQDWSHRSQPNANQANCVGGLQRKHQHQQTSEPFDLQNDCKVSKQANGRYNGQLIKPRRRISSASWTQVVLEGHTSGCNDTQPSGWSALHQCQDKVVNETNLPTPICFNNNDNNRQLVLINNSTTSHIVGNRHQQQSSCEKSDDSIDSNYSLSSSASSEPKQGKAESLDSGDDQNDQRRDTNTVDDGDILKSKSINDQAKVDDCNLRVIH